MDYQKLLEYYLTSAEWELEKTMFFEGWKHCYDLYEGNPGWGIVYPCSEIYLEYERRIAECGDYLALQLTDGQFQKYFDKRYSSEQRFAVIFALWWGLSEPQVNIIADLRQTRNSSRWLNYFLCNPDAAPSLSTQELNFFQYKGKYIARIYDQKPETPDKLQYRTVPLEDISLSNIPSERSPHSIKEST